MQLTVVWHKPCWRAQQSPTGFAVRCCLGHPEFGGLSRQVEALSELFDATRVVAPRSPVTDRSGETAIAGKNISVILLTWLPRSPWLTWLILPFWLGRNGFALVQEIWRADAVFALIPSPMGIIALVLALILRKPLLTRQLNNWSEPRFLWRLERALLERVAGGRNVIFATGDSGEPPSQRNREIRWLFSTTVSERQLAANAVARNRATGGRARLILVGVEPDTAGTGILLRALPLLVREFPDVTLDMVGDRAAFAKIQQLVSKLQLTDRVKLYGWMSRERLLELLRQADLFCLPADETEGIRHAVHEALACGLPVVTTHASIGPMLMGQGCGVILQESTPEQFAAAVRDCLSDSARYRAMSVAALRKARQYSFERLCVITRERLEYAWGPLQSMPVHVPAEARV
jgi:glycosyltransferase involved in cell wall biosynthesis